MRTAISSEYIKEMKANMKSVNEAMKRIAEAEKAQDNARNSRDYEKVMIAKIVDSINTWDEYYEFLDKVRASETYKRGWFVYSDQFDEGDKHSAEAMLGYGLTEQEALDVYKANKFAVENSGYDYADIYMYNLYEPYAPVAVYNRLMKQENVRAMQLQEIYNSIFEKI